MCKSLHQMIYGPLFYQLYEMVVSGYPVQYSGIEQRT